MTTLQIILTIIILILSSDQCLIFLLTLKKVMNKYLQRHGQMPARVKFILVMEFTARLIPVILSVILLRSFFL